MKKFSPQNFPFDNSDPAGYIGEFSYMFKKKYHKPLREWKNWKNPFQLLL